MDTPVDMLYPAGLVFVFCVCKLRDSIGKVIPHYALCDPLFPGISGAFTNQKYNKQNKL